MTYKGLPTTRVMGYVRAIEPRKTIITAETAEVTHHEVALPVIGYSSEAEEEDEPGEPESAQERAAKQIIQFGCCRKGLDPFDWPVKGAPKPMGSKMSGVN